MHTLRAVTTAVAAASAMIGAAPAAADNIAPAAGASCGVASANAQTYANAQSGPPYDVLRCEGVGEDLYWQPVNGIQRPAQAWYTYGPTETLHAGDLAGDWWVGVPATLDDICVADQRTVTGRTESASNNTGQYFGFHLVPDLDVLTLKGSCRWQPGQSRVG
jgi:hypothetical protein